MSVASTASQIRVACAWSSARKLGSPITHQAPAPKAMRANGSRRIQQQPQGSALPRAEPRSHDCQPLTITPAPRPDLLPQTAPPRHGAAASFTRKTMSPAAPAHDKTPPRSNHSDSALQPNHATLPTLPLDAGSLHKSATTGCAAQDELRIALTQYLISRQKTSLLCSPAFRPLHGKTS